MTSTTAPSSIVANPFAHLPADDPRHVLGRALVQAGATIDAVTPDQLPLATPCDEKDVSALVSHIVPVVERIGVLGRRGNIMTVVPHLDGTLDELRAGFVERADALTDAWADDARLDETVTFPWAVTDGAGALAMYSSELTLHTWDLAVATGQQPDWDADVLSASLAIMHEMLPAEGRTEGYQAVVDSLPPGTPVGGQPFGEAVPVADDAPLIDRLLGWTGRDPAQG